jgi:hypothetical protein
MPRRRSASLELSCSEDLTIAGFCRRKGLSKAGFYRLPQKVRDALITVYGPKTLRILPKAEAKFDRDRNKPGATEQRLIARMRAKHSAQMKKAAAASVVSRSKKRRAR